MGLLEAPPGLGVSQGSILGSEIFPAGLASTPGEGVGRADIQSSVVKAENPQVWFLCQYVWKA